MDKVLDSRVLCTFGKYLNLDKWNAMCSRIKYFPQSHRMEILEWTIEQNTQMNIIEIYIAILNTTEVSISC